MNRQKPLAVAVETHTKMIKDSARKERLTPNHMPLGAFCPDTLDFERLMTAAEIIIPVFPVYVNTEFFGILQF